jgi:hypothetical protein
MTLAAARAAPPDAGLYRRKWGIFRIHDDLAFLCRDIDALNVLNECMQYNYIGKKLPVNSPECRRTPSAGRQQS